MNAFLSRLLATALLAAAPMAAHAGDRHPATLRVIATADTSEVHPDSVFNMTLSVENISGAEQVMQIPQYGWDRAWKSSNGAVTWEPWGYDDPPTMTVRIPPHGIYVFPKPLPVYVKTSFHKARIDFRLGFKPPGVKILWSDSLALDVVQ